MWIFITRALISFTFVAFLLGDLVTPANAKATDEAAMQQLVVRYLEKINWGDNKSRQNYAKQNSALFLSYAKKENVDGQDIQRMYQVISRTTINKDKARELGSVIQKSAQPYTLQSRET